MPRPAAHRPLDDPIDSLPKELVRSPQASSVSPRLPDRWVQPLMLLGLVSGSRVRRDLLRCTWVAALNELDGAARVIFVVGNGAEDATRSDVLSVRVDEQRLARTTGRRGAKIHGVSSYSTYSLYAKTMAFLRHAASQPEPVVVLGDDDIFVQPHALLSYAWTLVQAARRGADSPLGWGGSEWYAGRFDWYSWRTETMQATAYWRAHRGALFGAMANYRNCSPTGAGWIPTADGKSVVREASAPAPGQERCVGPFAFAKGPLAMLSAPVVRWLVTSERFARDVSHAAAIADGERPRGRPVDRVPQDVQMGYWLAAHPTLRYVVLPKKTGWADAFVEVTDLRRLLVGHRIPWDQMAWLTRHTRALWLRAPHVDLQLRCAGPLCPAGQCSHARQQVACAMELVVPPPTSTSAIGCTNCDCWAGEGHARVSSGGSCNFTRDYVPRLPDHCWQPRE